MFPTVVLVEVVNTNGYMNRVLFIVFMHKCMKLP